MNSTHLPEEHSPDEDETGPIGIFPSWNALYGTVIVYTLLLIVILAVFTAVLDFGAR